MAGVIESGWQLGAAKVRVAMSQFPDPEQPSPQFPPQQPYPGSAPVQFDPQGHHATAAGSAAGQHAAVARAGAARPTAVAGQPPPRAAGFPRRRPSPPDMGTARPVGGAVPAGLYLDQCSGPMLPQRTQLASPSRRIGAFFLTIPLAIVTLFIGYIIWGLLVRGNSPAPALQVLGCAATGRTIVVSRASGGWRCTTWWREPSSCATRTRSCRSSGPAQLVVYFVHPRRAEIRAQS
jgi:hypothetical protein